MTDYEINIDQFRPDRDGKVGERCCLCKTQVATLVLTVTDPWCDGGVYLRICDCCARNLQTDIQLELDKR